MTKSKGAYMMREDERLARTIKVYIDRAMEQAEYKKLKDGDFVSKIPCCRGIVAFGKTLEECKAELLSTLEDWIAFGLSNGFFIPIVSGIDLNKEIVRDQMETLQA